MATIVTSLPSAPDGRLAERHHELRILRHFTFGRVEHLVFEEEHRILAPDRRPEHPLGVGRSGGHRDLEPGHVHVPALGRLRMLRRGRAGRAGGHTDRQGNPRLAAAHIARLRHLVHQLVAGHRHEVAEHDLDDGAQARHGRAQPRADDRRLADGGVAHAILPEQLHQIAADPPNPTERAHILADENDVGIAFHFLAHGFVDGLAVCDCSHGLFLVLKDTRLMR